MKKEILKKEIKKNYGKIDLEGNNDYCCSKTEEVCCDTNKIYKE